MMIKAALQKRVPRAIPIHGITVWIRPLTMAERISLLRKTAADKESYDSVYAAIALCVTEEDGTPVFSGPDDPALGSIPEDTAKVLSAAINKAAEGDVASAEKNSPKTI